MPGRVQPQDGVEDHRHQEEDQGREGVKGEALEDTEVATAVCFNAGNLPPAAEGLRAKYAGLRFLVCADDDIATPGNPGLKYAAKAAVILDAALAVPSFGADRGKPPTASTSPPAVMAPCKLPPGSSPGQPVNISCAI